MNTGLGFDIPENITDHVFIGFNPFATLSEAKTDCIESFNSSIHTPTKPELEKVERILRHEKRHLKYWWTGYKRFKYADFLYNFSYFCLATLITLMAIQLWSFQWTLTVI